MSSDVNKYRLNNDEENLAKESYQKFGNSNLEVDKLFDLFLDWQSSKTRSLKRFVLSFSFLVVFIFIVDLDITSIAPFGANIEDANRDKLFITLAIVHTIVFFYYLFQRYVDKKVMDAQISLFDEELNKLLPIYQSIEHILEKNSIPSFKALINNTQGPATTKLHQAEKSFNTLSFFSKKLESENALRVKADTIELWFIIILSLSTLLILLISLFS